MKSTAKITALFTIGYLLFSSNSVADEPCQVEPCNGGLAPELKGRKHNWSTTNKGIGKPLPRSKEVDKVSEELLAFAKKNNLNGKDYGTVCSAFIKESAGNGSQPKANRHWVRKSPRQFSKPKYSAHLFGKSVNSHNCVRTYGHGLSGDSMQLNSLKK